MRVKPYFATGGSKEIRNGRSETSHLTDVGIEDAKFMITPQLALDLTVNPDFAQAEVDEAQVNLTRFGQFFPEKREFFQERSGIFDFGSAERVGQPQVLLFHSRSIGLSEDRKEIPIYGGLKLTGKQGPLDIGVLNMQTQREDATPGQNFSTVRVKGNLLARSYVGAIFTRNTGGLFGGANRAGGMDASFTFWRNLNLRGFLAKSDSADRKDGEWAGQAVLDWESDRIEFTLEHISIQENFDPEMGFVRRGNLKRNFGELDYQPRPNIEGVRQMEFGTEFEIITNQEGRLETRRVEAEWGTGFESGDTINLQFTRTLERLEEPFSIRRGGTVPAGSYEFNEYQFMFRGFRGRRVSGNFTAAVGDFFNGRRTRVEIAPQIKPSEKLSFEPSYEWNKITLPDSQLTINEFNGRVNYSFTQRWLTATTVLVNSQDQQYTFNFRLNYILRSNDDLFIVYNETRSYGSGTGLDNRALIVKVTYSLDR